LGQNQKCRILYVQSSRLENFKKNRRTQKLQCVMNETIWQASFVHCFESRKAKVAVSTLGSTLGSKFSTLGSKFSALGFKFSILG
jgi:hypothetical protein